MRRTLSLRILLMLLLAAPAAVWPSAQAASREQEVGADLPYPPEGRPTPGDIVHVATGLPVSFDGLMDMVAGARLVCIGETHDNLEAHRVQLRILRELERRFPGRIALGMEMFRAPQQAVLDRWSRGELDEAEFLEAVDWRRTWGLDFAYYRDILAFARERRVDLIALNPSRELQDAVKRQGPEALPEELRSELPELGMPDPFQRALLLAVYRAHRPTGGDFEAFFRVQRLWEESMAERVVDYLQSARGAGRIMVTLTGGGHVEYGVGLPKKVLRRMPLPYVIVAPTEIEVPMEKRMPGVVQPEIPLLPADFIWWVNYEDLGAARGSPR
jgi:uncharacterized iron-regulated protein